MSAAQKYIGIAMAATGALWLTSNRRFVRRAVRTKGQVVDNKEKSDSDGVTYAPIFTFVDAAGATREVTSSWSSYPKEHEVGDQVDVLYLRDRPEEARIPSVIDMYVLPLGLCVIGFGLLVLG